jgi:hypothetical protein
MAGIHQKYTCRNCGHEGSVDVTVNAPEEVLLEAAQSDHAEASPDCSAPSIELGPSAADD